MHIKSIEIEGFKSYGKRTVIKGFDKSFNAVTGLNGSGKSNILDSICFVLGITNLSQVRAGSLDELVYKNGQAGITKAAVSIIFDNTDRHASPFGYDQHKEITVTRIIVIGGRNKYLINGTVATNHRVMDLFQSVQLNVNNPHFLIMQGRITKVLNMKPMEVLAMIEEATGTRMYETKRENSLKCMKRKDEKLLEINKIITETVKPCLENLKVERRDYLEYSKITRELEQLTKVNIAMQFVRAEENCIKFKDNSENLHKELKTTEDNINKLKAHKAEITAKVSELEKKKDEEAGGHLKALESELNKKQMAESKSNNALQNLKNLLKEESKKKAELAKHYQDDKNALVKKEELIRRLEILVNKKQLACEKDTEALSAAEKHLHAVHAGAVSSNDGEQATIADQIIAAKEEITKAVTDENVAEKNLAHLKEEIAKKEGQCKQADGSYKKNQEKYQMLEKEVQKLKQEISKLGYQEGKKEELETERNQLDKLVYNLRQKLDSMQSRFPQLCFNYVDPVKNFDRHKVHGLVCKLIRIKDSNVLTALEIAAGYKLYNIVVEDDTIGKLLLSKGQLRQRCTFIPLNKIIGNPIPNGVVQKAERLVGKDNVSTALSLISFDQKVRNAVEYVFGGVFICSDMECAKRVTFADGIHKRSVTYDGDSFDPSGTLSGGSMGNRTKILTELSKLSAADDELSEMQSKLNAVKRELQKIDSIAERYYALKNTVEIKENELRGVKTSLEQSQFHMQVEELNRIRNSLAEQQSILVNCKKTKKDAENLVKELMQKQKNAKSNRDQELKNSELALTKSREQLAQSQKEFKKAQQDFNQAKLEAEDISSTLVNTEKQIEDLTSTIDEHERNNIQYEADLVEKKCDAAECSEQVKSQKALLKAHSAEINKYHKDMEEITKNIDNYKLNIQQLNHDISKSTADSKDASHHVKRFLEKYHWIKEQKKYFGVPNTEFDFQRYDGRASSSYISQLEERKKHLSRDVNVKAQTMITTLEERYKGLMEKKRIVLSDKEKIVKVIEELDERKKAAVINACDKVNIDFGSIFSTLLPEAKAKLVPPEGKTVLEGLEFKVGFGDLWKESLTELSGGQRSLVALSLILAMLLFKPAPIYILDEVDAALDPSHTGNIGEMLKKHFKQSQFIVVSLREGMFNNANVLFRTKFIDGMSGVERHVQT